MGSSREREYEGSCSQSDYYILEGKRGFPMMTDGVDGIGSVGGPDGPERPEPTPKTEGAGGLDGANDGGGTVAGLGDGDSFDPGPENARWFDKIHELGEQQVVAGSELERIANQGFDLADEARIQQIIDSLLEEGL